jgi:hypothetical protein
MLRASLIALRITRIRLGFIKRFRRGRHDRGRFVS